MRVVLLTGKGGVGKTTTAAATAVAAAQDGLRTIVLSTDPAHSLGDALGRDLPDGVRVAVAERLEALHVSAASTVDASWRLVQDYLLSLLGAVGLDPVLAEELTSLPGVDELAALSAIRTLARAGDHDVVVVDCAPTAETLRLLALPEVLAWHLDRLAPTQRAVLGALRPAALSAAGIPAPPPQVFAAMREWAEHLREVQALLTSPATSGRLVLTPESVVIAEARRMHMLLGLHGMVVDAVVVNRVLPAATSSEGWLATWNEAQARGLELVRSSFAGIALATVPYTAGEPVGLDALGAMADQLGSLGRLTVPRAGDGVRVERTEGGYVLSLPVPGATSADLRLARREDDLLIDLAGHHRVVTLPAALRRGVVRGAAVVDGRLDVRFEDDDPSSPPPRAASHDASDVREMVGP